MGHKKLVQKIPFRPHHFHTVISRLFGPHSGGHNISDLLFDTFSVQRLGRKRRDRRFHGRRRHTFGRIGIATCVQYLHRNLAAGIMHTGRHGSMVGNIRVRKQARSTGKHATLAVGGHAAGNHQANPTARTGGIKFRHTVPILGLFQPGMHRAHEHAVFKGRKSQIKRGKHMRVSGHRGSPSNIAPHCAKPALRSPKTPRHPYPVSGGFNTVTAKRAFQQIQFLAQQGHFLANILRQNLAKQ